MHTTITKVMIAMAEVLTIPTIFVQTIKGWVCRAVFGGSSVCIAVTLGASCALAGEYAVYIHQARVVNYSHPGWCSFRQTAEACNGHAAPDPECTIKCSIDLCGTWTDKQTGRTSPFNIRTVDTDKLGCSIDYVCKDKSGKQVGEVQTRADAETKLITLNCNVPEPTL